MQLHQGWFYPVVKVAIDGRIEALQGWPRVEQVLTPHCLAGAYRAVIWSETVGLRTRPV